MLCERCGSINPEDSTFCDNCGSQLPTTPINVVRERLQLRMNDLKYSQEILAREGKAMLRKASLIRISLLILGAIVAARGVFEQFMVNYQAVPTLKMVLDLVLLLTGVAITILAGIEMYKSYGERGTAIQVLSQRCFSLIRRFMSDIDNAENARKLKSLDREMNDQLDNIYSEAVKHSVNLSDGNILLKKYENLGNESAI